MSYKYSSFISYRRNEADDKFLNNFKVIIESEALKVTNISKAFFDKESIQWGNEFDGKIYDGIVASYFFIPFYHNSYLHEDNLWCARELHHAIEVEKRIRESAVRNYCFILPIIDRGSACAFPDCIGKKNAKEIKKYRHLIAKKQTSAALEEFKDNIYDIFLSNFNLLDKNIKFSELCADIPHLSDDEIKDWIRVQKEYEKKSEAENPPILLKNEY